VVGLEGLAYALIAVATVSLLVILRRERQRGEASGTHPFLVGIYRGCAVVIVVFVALMVVGAVVTALTYQPFVPGS
jgi:hypothetical protein